MMTDESRRSRLDQAREPHFESLDARRMKLFHDDSGRLRLTVEGNRSYTDVKVVRAFPFSDREHFIGFLDNRDKVITLVTDLREMSPESREIALEALERHYFIPTIQRVLSLKEEFGAVYLDVETDRGRRQLVAKGLRDAIVDLGGGELLIADVDGNRYRIIDWRSLDLRSRRFLECVV
jgi:hypothetical protein